MESYILVDAGTIQDKNFIDKLKATGKLSKIGLLILTHGHMIMLDMRHFYMKILTFRLLCTIKIVIKLVVALWTFHLQKDF